MQQQWLYTLHRQKRASYSKSAAGLLPCCHQADIRMRSHRLLRLDDDKSAASCQQAWCKLIVKTFYPQVWCKLLQQVCKYQVATSLIFTDLLQLVGNLQQACGISGCVFVQFPYARTWIMKSNFSHTTGSCWSYPAEAAPTNKAWLFPWHYMAVQRCKFYFRVVKTNILRKNKIRIFKQLCNVLLII